MKVFKFLAFVLVLSLSMTRVWANTENLTPNTSVDILREAQQQITVKEDCNKHNIEADSAESNDQSINNKDDVTIDDSLYDIVDPVYQIPAELSQDSKTEEKPDDSAVDAVLTPVGWAIGGVIAPVLFRHSI